MLEKVVLARLSSIIEEVKKLAAEYYLLTGKPLGVTGEIAEHTAARLLDLELVPARTTGYDAIRRVGKRVEKIQIKGRAVGQNSKPGQRLGTIKKDADCDTVMLVLLDSATLEPIEISEARMTDVIQLLEATDSKARARGSLGVSTFKTKARIVWLRTE